MFLFYATSYCGISFIVDLGKEKTLFLLLLLALDDENETFLN